MFWPCVAEFINDSDQPWCWGEKNGSTDEAVRHILSLSGGKVAGTRDLLRDSVRMNISLRLRQRAHETYEFLERLQIISENL